MNGVAEDALALANALDALARRGQFVSGPCVTQENGTVLARVYGRSEQSGALEPLDALVIGRISPEPPPVRPLRLSAPRPAAEPAA